MTLPSGARLGPFEILSAIGAGGMGEVYRARDGKLNRDVALKILPAAFALDPDRLARFKREAQVLASLNHPNIAAIYGFEESHGVQALVLELVDGPTLADRMEQGPIPFREVFPIARQIAEGLDAAHEQGIIHRDLKPANIKLRSDGTVKVLDFGLATPMAGSELDRSAAVTRTAVSQAGTIVGTAVYMSPEQTRGLAVDKRTDIWAFGCVLYEMLTGRTAFEGATLSDITVSVLEREPDWSVLPPATPALVRRALTRCLQKDPKRRFRDIDDVRADLEEAGTHVSRDDAVAQPGSRAVRPSRLALLPAAGVIIAVAGLWTFRPAASRSVAAPVLIDRMTFDSGLTTMPALSADGRLLAYASDRAGRHNLDIWVQQTVGGAPLQLTDDVADDTAPDFSPDGSQIAFRSDRAGGGVYVVSTLGGQARLIAPEGRGPRFSSDGSRIAYWTGQFRGNPSSGASELFVIPLGGGAPVRLLSQFAVARDPVWSPDGRSLIVFGRRDVTSPPTESVDWWWVPIDRGVAVRTGVLDLAHFRSAEAVPLAWTPPGVLFTDGQNLWSIPISATSGAPTGAPRQVTFGTGVYRFATSARDATMAFDARSSERVIERVIVDADVANSSAPARLVADGQQGAWRASSTRDGSVIAFERAVRDRWEVWTKHLRTGREQLLVSVTSATQVNVTIAQDGSRVAYTVTNGPAQYGRGFVVETAGGIPKAVCDECSLHGFLSDHRRILSEVSNRHALRLHDVNTGAVQDLVTVEDGLLDRPHASADDRWLAFRFQADGTSRTFFVPLTPGQPAPRDRWRQVGEPTTTGRPAGWSLDSRTVYLLLDADGFRCLWGQRIDAASGRLIGALFPSKHFHGAQMASAGGVSTSFGNPITAAGFVYETVEQRADIWRLTAR
jgi:Tol biopolymer transport system component